MTASNEEPNARPALLGASHVNASEYPEGTRNLDLINRRQQRLGSSILFYHQPVHIVRGRGAWLFDDDGKRYLDCYNNVASVGHCHPHVVEALCAQAKQLNTHTRYLHRAVIDYAEMLTDRMPGELSVCMFTCTGTEANELAMRIARAVSGKRGIIVMESSYHGNSTLIHELSTGVYPESERPDHVATVEPPNTYRGMHRDPSTAGELYASDIDRAIDELDARGQGIAAFLCDTIFDTQGSLEAPPDYFQRVYEKVRAAGGLCVADEVQAGLARTGKMWGFEHYDVVPDIVTLGKPMGDGHPVAAVVTTAEIASQFAQSSIYFNTFGGNPVSASVGKAVLEVIDREDLLAQVEEVGTHLRAGLEDLATRHASIGNVRGKGLFLGIEFVKDRETLEPHVELAKSLPDRLREEGVLIGITGRHGNVLKVRPPLVFSIEDADLLLATLDRVLSSIESA